MLASLYLYIFISFYDFNFPNLSSSYKIILQKLVILSGAYFIENFIEILKSKSFNSFQWFLTPFPTIVKVEMCLFT